MNKTAGMLGLFAVGVAVGVIGTKWFSSEPDSALIAGEAVPKVSQPPTRAAGEVVAGPALAASASSGRTPAAPAEIAAAPPSAAASEPASASPNSPPLSLKTSPYATPIDSGSVQAIDVGDRLRAHIDRPSTPDHENQIGDAHRALEREPRDDNWAYTMEAELQNSMINEVSTGGFTVEGVDCRSTLCEVRVSGTAAQSAGVKRWNDSLMTQPFGQRLFMNYGSTFSDNDRVDGIFIFRKPQKP
jgi:hypothetical protein